MKYYLEKEDWKDIVQQEYVENKKTAKEVAGILGITENQFNWYVRHNKIYKDKGANWRIKHKERLDSGLYLCSKCNVWKNKKAFGMYRGTLRSYCKECAETYRLPRYRKKVIRALQGVILKVGLENGINQCQKCKVWKGVEEFYPDISRPTKLSVYCKSCMKAYFYTVWKNKTIEEKQSKLEYIKSWKERNKDKIHEYSITSYTKRKNDPMHKVRTNISKGISRSLKDNDKKYRSWMSIVDFTLEELKQHLESLFQKGMTWENYGMYGWHLDHRLPISSFNFESTTDKEFKKCWGLNNLQPLWAKDNLSKGAKLNWKKENK